MCSLERGTHRAHTLLRHYSERSGLYAFYMHHMGDFAMLSARKVFRSNIFSAREIPPAGERSPDTDPCSPVGDVPQIIATAAMYSEISVLRPAKAAK